MAVIIGSARIDERGRTHGGKAGDQGREVSRQNWYRHAKGWIALRPKESGAAERIARAMEAACDNQKIGYDQYQRYTLYNQAKKVDFDPGKVTTACETDCSALVRVCCAFAGITVGNFRTTNEANMLMATGCFDKLTDSKHTTIATYLTRGDILVTRTQGHTVVVLSDGGGSERVYELGERELSMGCDGNDVKAMQEALLTLQYDLGKWGADGDFGAATAKAVRLIQGDRGLVRDGVYGKATHAALMEALDEDDEDAPDDIGDADDGDEDAPADADDLVNKCILDLSQWNGKIKDAVKFGGDCNFAIHRASCGTKKDTCIHHNVKAMRQAQVPFGAYHYLKALDCQSAREEARKFYASAMVYFPTVWAIDCEYGPITKIAKSKKSGNGVKGVNDIVEAFREELVNLGVKRDRIGVYIGHHLYKLWGLKYSSFAFVWIPRYGSNNGMPQTKPDYKCDLWQYTSVGRCAGIADKTLDVNLLTGTGKTLKWFRGEE